MYLRYSCPYLSPFFKCLEGGVHHIERPIAGMAIGSKLLSEQPARDRAEHGALHKAVRLKSVLVRVNTEQLYISGFQIVVRKRVTFRWYASSFQRNI